jgi:tRNA G18 (ribose-2'-O)-methylase SpoU
VILAHNIRSILNLGSVFRSAEGFGVKRIYLSGYTPNWHDGLPHVRDKMLRQVHKTALGAEELVPSEYVVKITTLIKRLSSEGFRIVGLEQDTRAIPLPDYRPAAKIALLLGEEVHGLTPELRQLCDDLVEIPMFGQKESFNVSVAAGIALYHFTVSPLVAE